MTSLTLSNTRARSRSLASGPIGSPGGGARRLRLLPSGDGWSLVTVDGDLVVSALGVSGRRRCLEFAQAEDVVALTL
jgi:hypothetical protein